MKNVSGWYQSEYIVNYYSIFNKEGKNICKVKDMPVLCISNKNKYLILNFNKINNNKIDIYSFDGRLIKSIKYLKNNQINEDNNDKFLFDINENYFIWASDKSALIINLKNFKSETNIYNLEEYSTEKLKIQILDASVLGRFLNISMSIKSDKNEEKKSIKIDMSLIK
jgi:hypothetical protein